MMITVVADNVANENPAKQCADGKHDDCWYKVSSHLVCQLLYRRLDDTNIQQKLSNVRHSKEIVWLR